MRFRVLVLLTAVPLLATAAGCSSGGGGAPASAVIANDSSVDKAALLYPGSDGKFDQSQFMQWNAVSGAASYRLQIGSVAGAADLYDSGDVAVFQVRVPAMPLGKHLFGTLSTKYPSGQIGVVNFDATASGSDMPFPQRLEAARKLAADVRGMAGENNVPQPGSLLETFTLTGGSTRADCVDYANTMLTLISQMNLGVQARSASTCVIPNQYDCHSLVELLDEATGRWGLSDPTFGLAPHNAADGSIATLDEMRIATRAQAWSSISYEYLTPLGDSFANYYYLDYPLLFAQTYVSGPPSGVATLSVPVDPDTLTKYYVPVGSLPAPGVYGAYALQCPTGAKQTSALVNGAAQTFDCDPTLGASHIVLATTIVPQDGAVVIKPLRIVFPSAAF